MKKLDELLNLLEKKAPLIKREMKVGMNLNHSMRGKCRVHRMETSNPDISSIYVTFKGEVDVEEVSIACLSKLK